MFIDMLYLGSIPMDTPELSTWIFLVEFSNQAVNLVKKRIDLNT